MISLTLQRYCIADMTHYKSGKIGLRWRTEKEVISGKESFMIESKIVIKFP
nr:protein FRA10AC1 [Ipomoea batatas]